MFDNLLPLPGYALPQPVHQGDPEDDRVPVIRAQAQEIIDETLRSPDTGGSDARELLRQHLAQAPTPERAEEVLLAHLRTMVSLNNPGFGVAGRWGPDLG
jgi:hypothetical protein